MLAMANPLYYVLPVLWIACICGIGGHMRSTPAPDSDGNEIHCYCNLPSCITSSYMCKTEKTESGCFKRFHPISRQYHYGCLDLATKLATCSTTEESSTEEAASNNQCCFSDMCNHENAESSNLISSYDLSFNQSDDDLVDTLSTSVGRPTKFQYTNSDVWFRVVMILVPIFGFLTLLVLIYIAFRIFRADEREDRMSSSRLINEKYEIAAVSGGVKLPQSPIAETYDYNLGNSFKSTKYTLLERKFPFVFRQQQLQQHTVNENDSGAKSAKYQGFIPKYKYVADNAASVHHVPKMSEKFSPQNLTILKLPHKLNELKQKNSITNSPNNNSNNNNIRDYCISNNSFTDVLSHSNFISSDFNNFIR